VRRAAQPPPPAPEPKPKHHEGGGVLGFLGGIKDDVVHAVEHPLDTLESLTGAAARADADFVQGFAGGMRDMATAAWMLARVAPLTPTWYFSMAVDPEGAARLQRQFAQGLLHMAEDPVGTLGNMVDAKDLARGDVFRWAGHITPQIALTLATEGAGAGADAAAAGSEAAAEAAAADAAESVGEGAAAAAAAERGEAAGSGFADSVTEPGRGLDGAVAESGTVDRLAAGPGPSDPRVAGPLVGRAPEPEPPDLSLEELLARHGERLTDINGYRVTRRELDYAAVTPRQVADALERRAPLGTTEEQWAQMQSDLREALERSGLEGVDVGLGGSATKFYTGVQKPFDLSVDSIRDLAEDHELDPDEAVSKFAESPYGRGGPAPARHFFDSRYRLGIDKKSDLDFTISGRALDEAMQRFQAAHPHVTDLISEKGDVFKTRYVKMAFPHLKDYIERWTEKLGGRDVNIVGKPGGRGRAPGEWPLPSPSRG